MSESIPADFVPDPVSVPPSEEPKQRSFQLPSAYTILFIIIIGVAALTWIIPQGQFAVDDEGRPVPGTFTEFDGDRQGLYDILAAPGRGMYGIKSEPGEFTARDEYTGFVDQGTISVYNDGRLMGAIGVALFILVLGGFITIAMESGALSAGIDSLARSLAGRDTLLIASLVIAFALGGSTFGLSDEAIGFVAILIPLMLKVGLDAMVAVSVVFIGSAMGRIGGTVNPFSIGVASDSAGITTGDGIGLRVLILVVLVALLIAYTVRYARRIKSDPSKSVVADLMDDHRAHFLAGQQEEAPADGMEGRQKAVLAIFAGTFIIMIYSVIPWDDLGVDFLPTLGWFFGEFTGLFILGAILMGLVARMSEKKLTGTFVRGAGDFIGAALIVALARGVTVIMHNGQITDTILNSLAGVLEGRSAAGFAILMYLINIPLAFLVPSSSGHAALAIPIMAPLGDFADVSRSLIVTAFSAGNSTMNLFSPASAVLMGVLGVSRIGYGTFFKFVTPILIGTFVILIVLIGGAAIIS